MRRSFGAGALALAWVAGCTSANPWHEVTGATQSAIQGGTDDTTHDFAVAVVQVDPVTGNDEICSGALLAPNLVATARHCVATLTSSEIMCGTSTFGSLVPESSIFVSIEAQIQSTFVTLAPGGILVPTAANQTDVCGNDIALLILKNNIVLGSKGGTVIDLRNYVVPAIDPPMTDPSYSTNVTAIGYGIDSPTDDAGLSAGTRRIKQNIPLACIPNDASSPGLDCFKGSGASVAEQILTANEFVSGNASTCEGDSGSNAFDQAYFDKGEWVSFGVLSRGSVSPDGQTCVQPIYSRFDAWSALLIKAAKQAQAMAKPAYPLPLWASGAALDASFPPPSSSSGASSSSASTSSSGVSSSSSGPGTASTGQTCIGAATATQGTVCACPSDCVSNECVTIDGTNYVCANPCSQGPCSSGFTCRGSASDSYCFPDSLGAAPPPGKSGGCAAAPLQAKDPAGWGSSAPLAGIALAGLRRLRGRRRRAARA